MNHSTKLSRRSLLLLLSGTLATTVIAVPAEAAKKKKSRNYDRYYPRNYPTPVPSPAVPVPSPEPEPSRPTSPVTMLGVGGGALGSLGFLSAWLIKKNQKTSTPPTPEPVQRRVKPVKQATPEVADWYVFRSGKAEGPYTALQLWEIQRITDRTKVRRGEADWQKAGEISELAKYLSQK